MLVNVDYAQFSVFVNYLRGYYSKGLSIVKKDGGPVLYYISKDDSIPRLVAKDDEVNTKWYVKDMYHS